MELKKQVCSLELAKRLKELGVKQESVFDWETGGELDGHVLVTVQGDDWNDGFDHVSAFTVAELGEMLPELNGKGWLSTIRWSDGTWRCSFNVSTDNERHFLFGPTEAEARAAILICLLENGLLKS